MEREWFKLGIKPGLSYVPKFEQKGFISTRPGDLKPWGIYLPLSLVGYIGKNGRYLQLGASSTWHYGDFAQAIPLGQEKGWENGQSIFTGLRFEKDKWVFSGQFLLLYDLQELETGFAPYWSVGVGRAF